MISKLYNIIQSSILLESPNNNTHTCPYIHTQTHTANTHSNIHLTLFYKDRYISKIHTHTTYTSTQ